MRAIPPPWSRSSGKSMVKKCEPFWSVNAEEVRSLQVPWRRTRECDGAGPVLRREHRPALAHHQQRERRRPRPLHLPPPQRGRALRQRRRHQRRRAVWVFRCHYRTTYCTVSQYWPSVPAVRPVVRLLLSTPSPVLESQHRNVTLTCAVDHGNPAQLDEVLWYLDGDLLKHLPDCNSTDGDGTMLFTIPRNNHNSDLKKSYKMYAKINEVYQLNN